MRRRLALLTTTILGLLLVAAPAMAAAEETAEAEAGLWDGLIYAAIGGVVIGLFVFFDAYAGADDSAGHDDHH